MLKGLLSVVRSRCLPTSIKLQSRFFSTCNQLRENRVRCGIDPAMRGVCLSVPKTGWRGGGKVSEDKIATSSLDFRLAQGVAAGISTLGQAGPQRLSSRSLRHRSHSSTRRRALLHLAECRGILEHVYPPYRPRRRRSFPSRNRPAGEIL